MQFGIFPSHLLGRFLDGSKSVPHFGQRIVSHVGLTVAAGVIEYEPLRDARDDETKESEVVVYAQQFREAWTAQEANTADERTMQIQVVNAYLDEIFGLRAIDPFSGTHPRMRANFETGEWKLNREICSKR